MKALLFCYPLLCLLLGTVSGSASWLREAGMHALVVLALGAAFLAARRQERWPLVGGLFEPLLALLFLVLAAGAWQSPCAGRSWRMLVLLASATAAFYLAASAGADRDRTLLWSVLPATGAAAALVGLAAYALRWTPRVSAPLGHHNYMAGFLLLHLPLAAEAAAAARSRAARVFWYAAVMAQALAIFLTGSLAGVAVLAGLALFAAWGRIRKRDALARPSSPAALHAPGQASRPAPQIAALVALLLLAGFGALLFRWSRSPVISALRLRVAAIAGERRDPSLSLENRLRYLRTSLAMAAAHPLIGSGLGAVPLTASLYREQKPGFIPPGEALRHLHNLPANLLAETGALGLSAALLLALTALWGQTGAAAAAVWAYLVFSLSDYQLDLPAILFPLALVAGLAVVGTGSFAGAKSEPATLPRWLALGALFFLAAAGVVLLACSTIGHYYHQRGDFLRAAQWDAHCGFYAFQAGARAEQLGEINQARSHYLEAAGQMPAMIPVAAQAGHSLVRAGQYTSALPWLERAAALDYYFTLAHFHLGRARLRTGDREGAIEAFATSLLVQPATVLAEDWLSLPEREVYSESLERALDRLYELAAFYPESGPWRRWNELGAFLVGRRALLPNGPHRVLFFEVVDRDLAVNHSLIVFRRPGRPQRVAPVVLLAPTPDPRPPAGLGAIEGLPSVRALDLPSRSR